MRPMACLAAMMQLLFLLTAAATGAAAQAAGARAHTDRGWPGPGGPRPPAQWPPARHHSSGGVVASLSLHRQPDCSGVPVVAANTTAAAPCVALPAGGVFPWVRVSCPPETRGGGATAELLGYVALPLCLAGEGGVPLLGAPSGVCVPLGLPAAAALAARGAALAARLVCAAARGGSGAPRVGAVG